jgi:hypothetical protein
MSDTSASKSASIKIGTDATASYSSARDGFAAPWLGQLQRRLNLSIGLGTAVQNREGQWLGGDVVTAANNFFQATSDMFPAEPYIYSSREGDLVAEFSGGRGPLTMILSPKQAIAFAVVDGRRIHKEIPLTAVRVADLRAQLAEITDVVLAGQHGPVDPAR